MFGGGGISVWSERDKKTDILVAVTVEQQHDSNMEVRLRLMNVTVVFSAFPLYSTR